MRLKTRFKQGSVISILFILVLMFQNCSQPYSVKPTNASSSSSASTGSNVAGDPNGGQGGNPGSTTPGGSQPTNDPSNGTGGGNGTPTVCTPQTTTSNLRIMFMVDASGSTINMPGGYGWVGTDPSATLRTQAALNFIKANSGNPNLSYSYSYFSTGTQTYDFNSSQFIDSSATNSSSALFGTASQETLAANSFASDIFGVNASNGYTFPNGFSVGGTNYEGAFNLIKSMVVADKATNSNYSYVVVFMSDGQPNLASGAVDDTGAYLKTISQIISSAGGPNHGTVSGVYFGPSDKAASDVINNIAKVGGGQFADINTTSLTLSNMIQSIINVPTGACQ